MRNYTYFDADTGRPLYVQTSREPPADLFTREGDLLDHWCDSNGNLWKREALDVTQDRTTCTPGETVMFSGLPDPCEVKIDGVLHTVTGGVLNLTCATVGYYGIKIDMPQYLPQQYEVICDEP